MTTLTLNCDLGESFGIYSFGADAGVMPHIDLANVACGFHASDFNHMRSAVRLCKAAGVKVGAHPSLPDRQGFGRREMAMSREELANCLIYQIGALTAFLKAEGAVLNHIKPHGALYGMAARNAEIAEAIADAADVFPVPLLGLPGTLHETVYQRRGHRFIAEFFADLDYGDAGELLITRKHGAVDPQLARQRVRDAARGALQTVGGRQLPVRVETICVHSDTPNAIEVAAAVAGAISEV